MEQVRKLIADKINAKPNEIFFTSGGCEGNSWVIDNFSIHVYDPLSHSSVIDKVLDLNSLGIRDKIRVNEDGILYLNDLMDCLKKHDDKFDHLCRILLTVCGANNEIGTIQPINEISKIVKKVNDLQEYRYSESLKNKINRTLFLHVDGTQMLPCMKIDVQDLGIDMLTFSGAKIGCPSGIGFAYIKEEVQKFIDPLIYGEQERGLRGGTENVPYILGLGKAIQLLDTDTSHLESLRDYFINKLLTLPNTKLVGSKINRLPNNINICFGNIDATALLSYLNLNGIYASSGSACNSNSLEPSHVLKEIGLSDTEANSCVRFTLSNDTTIEELEEVFQVIERFVTRQDRYFKGE